MWFSVYFHITVKWTGTAPPTNQNHPARHMHRFDEKLETVEEFRCYNQNDVNLVKRQTENLYRGPNRTATIQRVSQTEAIQVKQRIDDECRKLEELLV